MSDAARGIADRGLRAAPASEAPRELPVYREPAPREVEQTSATPLDRPPPPLAPSLPVLTKKDDRKKAIVLDTPCRFVVRDDGTARASPAPVYAIESQEMVSKNDFFIQKAAYKYGVEPDLVRAVIWMESTHGWYDNFVRTPKSLRPMNVHAEEWKDLASRADLEDAEKNILVGTLILSRIIARVENPTVDKVGTLYNALAKDDVSTYGRTLAHYYKHKPWSKKPR